MRKSVYQRIVEKVRVDSVSGCWEWQGSTVRGYGAMQAHGKTQYIHRLSYEMAYGPIPVGMVIDHLCRNLPCCNPDHLEPVTQKVNMERSAALRTHCPHGHEYTKENTQLQKRHGGYYARVCKTCRRIREHP